MESEVHLFILWENARYQQEKILADMACRFTILKKFAITWTPELVSSNFTRFYGVNLPDKSGKEKECGKGEFLLCVVRDEHPIYTKRHSGHTIESVDANMLDAKALYCRWIEKKNAVYCTTSPRETNYCLALLLGKNTSDFLEYCHQTASTQEITLSKDLEGAEKWRDLSHLFYVMNATLDYCVLRNFETLPDKHDPSIHGDIDLLVEDKEKAALVMNATSVYPEAYRVYHMVQFENGNIPFDLRYVGDHYYDTNWEKEVLEAAQSHTGVSAIFKTTTPIHQYYTLLYHAYIQKKNIAEDYPLKLQGFAQELGISYRNDIEYVIAQLDQFMKEHGYQYIRPIDKTVIFNWDNLRYSHSYNTLRLQYYMAELTHPSSIKKIWRKFKRKIKKMLRKD